MPFANVERVPGGYVVSRLFTNQAAAQRGMDLLLSVNEQAFEPVRAYDAHPFNPVAAEEAGPEVTLEQAALDIARRTLINTHRVGPLAQRLLDGQPLNLPSDADGS